MSMMMARNGGRVVLEARHRIRDDEQLRDRDRRMYRDYVEGRTAKQVGAIYRLSESVVCRRFKKIPAAVKSAIRRDVGEIRRMRLEALASA